MAQEVERKWLSARGFLYKFLKDKNCKEYSIYQKYFKTEDPSVEERIRLKESSNGVAYFHTIKKNNLWRTMYEKLLM